MRVLAGLARAWPLVIVLGCSDPSYRSSGLLIRTDSAAYSFHTSTGPRVEVTFENVSPRTVSLAACGNTIMTMMEQAIGRTWSDATRTACVNIPFEPVPLAPGASVRAYVNPIVLGTYRLRAPLFRDGTQIHHSRETSGTFEVR